MGKDESITSKETWFILPMKSLSVNTIPKVLFSSVRPLSRSIISLGVRRLLNSNMSSLYFFIFYRRHRIFPGPHCHQRLCIWRRVFSNCVIVPRCRTKLVKNFFHLAVSTLWHMHFVRCWRSCTNLVRVSSPIRQSRSQTCSQFHTSLLSKS